MLMLMLAAPGAAGPAMSLEFLDKAHCNDGSPAGMYARKSQARGKASVPWVIYLEGGGWCYSENSCQNRWKKRDGRMTSDVWEDDLEADDGIFSQDCDQNPTWCDANHVYLRYCTSDGWIGTATRTNIGYSFEGSLVIDEAIKTLMSGYMEDMPRLRRNAKVLLTGCSAGGRGAMFNIDRVQETLPNVKGFFDSAWWLTDIQPFYDRGKWITEEAQDAFDLYKPNLDNTCTRAHRSAEHWKCFFAPFAMPYVETPSLSQVYQYDKALLCKAVRCWAEEPTWGGRLLAYAEDWRAETFRTFSLVGFDGRRHPHRSLFSPACHDHCSLHTKYFFRTKVRSGDGRTMTAAEALRRFWAGERVVAVDTCAGGFVCGNRCNNDIGIVSDTPDDGGDGGGSWPGADIAPTAAPSSSSSSSPPSPSPSSHCPSSRSPSSRPTTLSSSTPVSLAPSSRSPASLSPRLATRGPTTILPSASPSLAPSVRTRQPSASPRTPRPTQSPSSASPGTRAPLAEPTRTPTMMAITSLSPSSSGGATTIYLVQLTAKFEGQSLAEIGAEEELRRGFTRAMSTHAKVDSSRVTISSVAPGSVVIVARVDGFDSAGDALELRDALRESPEDVFTRTNGFDAPRFGIPSISAEVISQQQEDEKEQEGTSPGPKPDPSRLSSVAIIVMIVIFVLVITLGIIALGRWPLCYCCGWGRNGGGAKNGQEDEEEEEEEEEEEDDDDNDRRRHGGGKRVEEEAKRAGGDYDCSITRGGHISSRGSAHPPPPELSSAERRSSL